MSTTDVAAPLAGAEAAPVSPGARITGRAIALIAIAALSAAAAAIMLYSTELGAGMSPDSVSYVDAARNLTAGRGYVALARDGVTRPLTTWPPLLPATLALIGLAGFDLLDGARWLISLLFGANVFLVGLCLYRWTREIPWAAVLGSFLALVSFNQLQIHAWVWSEPLFLFCTFLGFFLLAEYLERPRLALLVAAGIAIAGAVLTRYAGAAAAASAILAVLLLAAAPRAIRLRHALLLAAISLLPLVLFALRNRSATGGLSSRVFAFHPVLREAATSAAYTFSAWIMPWSIRGSARWALFLLCAVALLVASSIVLLRRGEQAPVARGIWLLILFVPVYIAALIASLTFYDASSPLDDRLLTPVFVAGLIVSLYVADRLVSSYRAKSVEVVTAAVVLALSVLYVAQAKDWVGRTHAEGNGYTSPAWRNSETIALLRSMPEGTPILTNERGAIYLLTGRPTVTLPFKVVSQSLLPNPTYEQEMTAIKQRLLDGNGVVVIFNTIPWTKYTATLQELREQLSPLVAVARAKDGVIFKVGK